MTYAGDSSPLFAAKVSPPRLRSPSVRADQLAKVAQAREARVLLVRAPAGYGKTTLIAAAANDLEWQHVWYRLDATDSDPRAFLHSLTLALRRRRPGFGDALLEATTETEQEPVVADLVTMLARELAQAAGGDLFVILDEYETLASAAAFNDVLVALLDRLPPAVHVLVLSRGRPSFPTAGMAADGRLIEMTHRDLRFGREQVAEVVERQSGKPPTSAVVDTLLHLTEGWAAGVVLAGKTMRWLDPGGMDDSLRGRDLEREVFPYLAEQIYTRQSRPTREFLKATCCLESMTTSLAQTVAGSRAARILLAQLESEEIFTFTDAAGGAYRYHPLFRRFVQTRLIQEEGDGAFRTVQRRTADGLAAHSLVAAAVALYLELDQPEPPLAIVRERGRDVLDECSEDLVSRWADALRRRAGSPSGWASLLEGHRLLRRGHLEEACELLRVPLDALGEDRAGLHLAHKELAHCYFYAGDNEDAIHHLREALALAESGRQEAECYAMLAFVLSSSCRWQELDEALAAFEERRPEVPATLSARIAGLESQSALMRGDVRRALRMGEGALPLVRGHSSMQTVAGFLNLLAIVNYTAGRYGRAAQLLREMRELCDAYQLAKRGAELEVTRGTLLAQQGRRDEALAVFEQALVAPALASDPLVRAEIHLRRGAVLRRSDILSEAAQAYERALQIVQHRDSLEDEISSRIDLAFTQGLSGASEDAPGQIRALMDQAGKSQLLFHLAKGAFFQAVLEVRRGNTTTPGLRSSCEELLRLGHLDFLGQELVAHPEAARALLAAGVDDAMARRLLAVLAPQAGGPALLARLAGLNDRAGLLVLEAARLHLTIPQASRLLETLRRHPSRRVRDQAQRVVLPGAEAADRRADERRTGRPTARPDDRRDGRLFPELTPREEEVLAVLAEGSTNEEIARRLFLTVATVKSHVRRILAKTGAQRRQTAALLYRRRAAKRPGEPSPIAPSPARRDETPDAPAGR